MNIVVTGGTKGIGRAIIETFAGKGFNVYTCSRNADDLILLKKELTTQFPGINVFTETCDMGDKAQVQNLAKNIGEKFDKIDILVNNAGLFLPGSIAAEEDGTFETMMNLNIGGCYHMTRGLLPVIKRTAGSHIFNMGSISSISAYTNGGSYSISKYALHGFSKLLREELKPDGVKVTTVLAGATLTNSWAGTTLPRERFMDAKEVAKSVLECYELKTVVVEELILRPMEGDIN